MSDQGFASKWLGLWHLALKVQNLARSRAFYQDLLGMKTVWEPDTQNIYLSFGQDNLALHQIPEGTSLAQGDPQSLDHFGFMVRHKEDVDQMARRMEQAGIPIVHPVRLHRDGSYSFYMEDPDRNLIQILYEPRLNTGGARTAPATAA